MQIEGDLDQLVEESLLQSHPLAYLEGILFYGLLEGLLVRGVLEQHLQMGLFLAGLLAGVEEGGRPMTVLFYQLAQ